MSTFEDYQKVSKNYDDERSAMGADVMAGLLHVHGGKPLKELHLLDAGCGTGNFTKALIDYGVGKVTLLDASAGMLDKAKDKLKDAMDKNIIDKVVEAKMPPLPFEDGSFDAILFSLVLHHLDKTADGENFPAFEEMFREANRVLRHNGVMIVAESTPPLIKEANWFAQLNLPSCERYCKLYPSVKQYLAMYEKTGFKCVAKLNLLGSDLMPNYFDPQGPLKEEWRSGVSLYAVTTQEEINEIEQKLKGMIKNGTVEQFIKEHDRTLEIGFSNLTVCVSEQS